MVAPVPINEQPNLWALLRQHQSGITYTNGDTLTITAPIVAANDIANGLTFSNETPTALQASADLDARVTVIVPAEYAEAAAELIRAHGITVNESTAMTSGDFYARTKALRAMLGAEDLDAALREMCNVAPERQMLFDDRRNVGFSIRMTLDSAEAQARKPDADIPTLYQQLMTQLKSGSLYNAGMLTPASMLAFVGMEDVAHPTDEDARLALFGDEPGNAAQAYAVLVAYRDRAIAFEKNPHQALAAYMGGGSAPVIGS